MLGEISFRYGYSAGFCQKAGGIFSCFAGKTVPPSFARGRQEIGGFPARGRPRFVLRIPYPLNWKPRTGLVPLPRFGRISCAESLQLMPDAVFCRRNWTVWSRVRPDFAGRFSAFTLYAAHDIDKRKHRPRPALVRRKDEFRFPFRFGTGHGESEGRYIRLMRATGEMSIGANSPR